PDGGLPIEVCDDPTGKDEDGDGFANCDDFECAALPVCCGGSTGSTSFLETWSGSIGDHWNPVPSTDTTYPITNEASEELDSFGAGSAAVAKQCVPLRVGAEVRVDFRPTGEGSGSDYASILLTGSEDAATFDRLIEDLRVVAQGNSLFVTSGGIAVGSSVGIAAGAKTSVAIVVTPSLDTAGNGILVARVSAQTKGKSHVLVEAYPFLAQDDLVAAGACGAVPGLYLGVVGVGEGMALGRIEVAPLECVNPSQFTAYPDKFAETPIEGSSLSSEAWGGGGVGSPAILVSSGESPTWDIFFDAPDAPREQDQYRDLPFSLGHARWESSTPAWDTRATAKCSRAMVSVREPSLFGALTAYARKGPPGEPQGIDVTSSKAEELEESFG
ncbi:MAG: hypothetical protein KC416_17145, partial [Myxococcales bacterium]|nr:hypothetical protein [Myxococcales bacterium]